jgi:hypothetical protein
MVVRAGRTHCIFRLFCADHIPSDVMHMTAPVHSDPPTHSAPTGQIHVPRVWEVTGRRAHDDLAADRESVRCRQLLSDRLVFNGRKLSRKKLAAAGTRSV